MTKPGVLANMIDCTQGLSNHLLNHMAKAYIYMKQKLPPPPASTRMAAPFVNIFYDAFSVESV